MNGDDPICFWKGSVLEFFNPSPMFKWYPFTNDLAVGDVQKPENAGMFQLKMAVNNPIANGRIDWK